MTRDPMSLALANCSPSEARAIWCALDMLLSDLDECIDEDDPSSLSDPKLIAARAAARSVQDRLDAAMASFAKDSR